jgi:hypothetical protein
MRCAVIEAEKATYPIAWMSRLLEVPRSSFYSVATPRRHRDDHAGPTP